MTRNGLFCAALPLYGTQVRPWLECCIAQYRLRQRKDTARAANRMYIYRLITVVSCLTPSLIPPMLAAQPRLHRDSAPSIPYIHISEHDLIKTPKLPEPKPETEPAGARTEPKGPSSSLMRIHPDIAHEKLPKWIGPPALFAASRPTLVRWATRLHLTLAKGRLAGSIMIGF